MKPPTPWISLVSCFPGVRVASFSASVIMGSLRKPGQESKRYFRRRAATGKPAAHCFPVT